MKHEISDPLADIPKHIQDKIPADVKQKIERNQALQAAIFELSDLFALLKQDVSELHDFGNQNESNQAWRRSVYRAVFSWIEGVVYQMKQVAVCTQGGYYQAEFSRAEMAFLQEESYYLDDKGKVKTTYNNFVEIDKNLRFAYSKLVAGFNLSTKLEVDRQGWEHFKKAITVRNCLTHPKNTIDLLVTDENMGFLIDTIKWFDEQTSKLIADIRATVEPILENIKAEGKANIQNIVDNAMAVFARASKVENVIAIIDELALGETGFTERKEKLETVKSNLDELKKEIVSDLNGI